MAKNIIITVILAFLLGAYIALSGCSGTTMLPPVTQKISVGDVVKPPTGWVKMQEKKE